MQLEEITEQVHGYTFAHLAEHPTHSLVHQVVRMVQMDFGITQTPRGVTLLRGLPRTDDAHTLFPEAGAGGQVIEHLNLVRPVSQIRGQEQPMTQYLVNGHLQFRK